MPIERFSLDDFKKAFPDAEHLGYLSNQHVFRIKINNVVSAKVYTTIDLDGFARSIDSDSIKIVMVENKGDQPISGKVDTYTTREAGWAGRIQDKVNILHYWHDQAGYCPVCKQPNHINRVSKEGPNKGRLFAGCTNFSHNSFKWLVEKMPADYFNKSDDEPSTETQPKDIVVKNGMFEHALVEVLDISSRNDHQKAIIQANGIGIGVVSAGAGSGKTTVISDLVVSHILKGGNPNKIIAITFSTKAAAEMRVRMAKKFWPDITDKEIAFFSGKQDSDDDPIYSLDRTWVDGNPIRQMLMDRVCTIHAMNYRILKAFGETDKVLRDRTERDAMTMIKDSMAELDWEDSPKSVRTAISVGINNLIRPDTVSANMFYTKMFAQYGVTQQVINSLSEIYVRYHKFCKKNHVLDFDMMQTRVIERLRNDRAFLSQAQDMFDFIVVDEAQDTNDIQFEIINTLAAKYKNLYLVGDTRQSIYRWRGAVPSNMEEYFDAHWGAENVKRFSLPINYRSNKVIVDQTNKMIRQNYTGERQKYLVDTVSYLDADGDPFEYYEQPDFDSLGDDICRQILEIGNYGKWYILSRTRAECAALHVKLLANKIPAVNLSGGLIFGSPHIRKVIAYAALGCDFNGARNNTEILKEVANVASDKFIAPMNRRRHLDTCHEERSWIDCGCPVVMEEGKDRSYARYYGAASIDEARNWRGIQAQTYDKNRGGYPTLKSKGALDLIYTVDCVEQRKDDAKAAIEWIIDHVVLPWYAHEEGISLEDLGENGIAEDFDVIKTLIEPGSTLQQFLTAVDSMTSPSDDEEDTVKIMTIHKSKGLENDYVIVNTTRMPVIPPKLKPGMLPVGGGVNPVEERCLAYVAVTRAKHRVWFFGSRDWNGQQVPTSPFIGEFEMLRHDIADKVSGEYPDDLEGAIDAEFTEE